MKTLGFDAYEEPLRGAAHRCRLCTARPSSLTDAPAAVFSAPVYLQKYRDVRASGLASLSRFHIS